MSNDDVRQFIVNLQECWQAGEVDRIADFYHPGVVLLPPDLGAAIRGRDAVVDSYRQFLSAATLERFDITALEVFDFDIAGGNAPCMVHLGFEIAYELTGERYVDKGLEVYAVADDGGRPCIVWRTQHILDSRLAEKSDPGNEA